MKVRTIRLILLISTAMIALFSMLLIMGLVAGIIEPPWIAFVVGGNALILLFNSIILYVTGSDKTWWETKDNLDEHIEVYKRKCMAYERAREDLIQVQLKYHYDNAKDKYDETLKKLDD